MEQDNASDAELLTAHLAGDSKALEALFCRYRLPFYAYLNRMLESDRTAADDLFQDLWVRILDKATGCRDRERFAAWAFQIARNLVMEHFRRSKRRDMLARLTGDGTLPDTPAAPDTVPGARLQAMEMREKLAAALPQLPPEQREVFLLRRNGISFRDIAEMQGCSVNTALSRMRYATQWLRRELLGEESE